MLQFSPDMCFVTLPCGTSGPEARWLLGEPLDKEGLNTKYVCSPLPDIPCTALALADLIKHTTNEVLKGITYLLDPKVII